MSDNIPSELVYVILSRLDVKTLLCSRSVSKKWRSIIDSQVFQKYYLGQSTKTNENSHFIFNSRVFEVHYVDFGEVSKPHKLQTPIGSWTVSSSCNGIVLLVGIGFGLRKMALFNPATRTYQFLPYKNASGFYIRNFKERYGLGYDSIGNDFKVVSIMKVDSVWKTKIFSLKMNSWKNIKDFPYKKPSPLTREVEANGALHFVVHSKQKWPEFIVALDLALENYLTLELPKIPITEGIDFFMNKLGECLCVYAKTQRKTDIWVMKEYGVAESWTKLISFTPPYVSVILPLKALGYSKDGAKVLLQYNHIKFGLYDLRSKQHEYVDMTNHALDAYFNVGHHIESLLKLEESTEDIQEYEEGN